MKFREKEKIVRFVNKDILKAFQYSEDKPVNTFNNLLLQKITYEN